MAHRIEEMERSLRLLEAQYGHNDPRTMVVRDNLAVLYRNAGQAQRAHELYARADLCEHLQPVEKYLRDQGAKVFSVCRPWTQNCRTWVYFANVVLDLASMRRKLNLPECVEDFVHRGTVDGAEQGFVCKLDHDGVMGMHPDVAPENTRHIG
jgi:hypothetical protein